jgi:hypothetical protein
MSTNANQEDFNKLVEEERATSIIPFKMRRLFKMRDPYPVVVARNWARDMSMLECVLVLLCLFVIASLRTTPDNSGDDVIGDDDQLVLQGVEVTGGLGLSTR